MQFNYVIPYAIQSCNIPMSWAVNYAGLYLCRSSFQIKLMMVVPVKIEHIFSWCIFQDHCFASEMSWRQRLIYWMLIYIDICYIWDKWRTKNLYCFKTSWNIWSVYQCEINFISLEAYTQDVFRSRAIRTKSSNI